MIPDGHSAAGSMIPNSFCDVQQKLGFLGLVFGWLISNYGKEAGVFVGEVFVLMTIIK